MSMQLLLGGSHQFASGLEASIAIPPNRNMIINGPSQNLRNVVILQGE